MKNSSKGVTFISVIVLLALTIIITSVSIIAYTSVTTKTKRQEFSREIKLIEDAIYNYTFLNNNYPLKEEIKVDLTSVDSKAKEQFINEPNYSTDEINLYIIDLKKALIEELKRGTGKLGANDIYVYSKATNTVYYLNGTKIGGEIYYTLDEGETTKIPTDL